MSRRQAHTFSPRLMVQDLLHDHERREFLDFFCAGSPQTTPHLCSIDARWHFPWRSALFTLALIIFVLLFMVADFWARENLDNLKLFLGALVIGSAAVPLGILSFFAEMNLWRNISWLRVAVFAALGGAVALVISLLFLIFDIQTTALGAGFIEEPAKMIAVLLLAERKGRNGRILNGMLLGAAVGAGFAVFESMGYAYEALFLNDTGGFTLGLNYQHALSVMAARSIFCLTAGHVTWTAISCAALWACMKDRHPLRALFHPLFLVFMAAAALVHGYWNVCTQAGYILYLAPLFGIVTWFFIAVLYNWGLRQIKKEQADCLKEEHSAPCIYLTNRAQHIDGPYNAEELTRMVQKRYASPQQNIIIYDTHPHLLTLGEVCYLRPLFKTHHRPAWYQCNTTLWFRGLQLLCLGTMASFGLAFYNLSMGISGYITCGMLLALMIFNQSLQVWKSISLPEDAQDEEGALLVPHLGLSLWIKMLIPLYHLYWGYVVHSKVFRCVNYFRTGEMSIPLWIARLYWTNLYLMIILCAIILIEAAYAFAIYTLFLIALYPLSAYLMGLALLSAQKSKIK